MYDLLSTGMLQVSSILAYADRAEDTVINPGEASSLMVVKPTYVKELVKQLIEIKRVICFGVGVGLGVGTIPLHSKNVVNCINLYPANVENMVSS
jgi:hypothetical protein